jgi:hypothetical protein
LHQCGRPTVVYVLGFTGAVLVDLGMPRGL